MGGLCSFDCTPEDESGPRDVVRTSAQADAVTYAVEKNPSGRRRSPPGDALLDLPSAPLRSPSSPEPLPRVDLDDGERFMTLRPESPAGDVAGADEAEPQGWECPSEPLDRLTYVSVQRARLSSADVARIGVAAQRRNAMMDVTGFLVHCPPYFFQTIEGPPEAVSELIDRIIADPRHCDVDIIECIPVDERMHPRWAMDVVEIGRGTPEGWEPPVLSRAWLIRELVRHAAADHRDAACGSLASAIDLPSDDDDDPLEARMLCGLDTA